MSAIYDIAKKAYESIKEKIPFDCEMAITLGSGLSSLAEKTEIIASIPYADIEGFPVSTVSGHAGNLLFAKVGEKNVLFMQGRVHYYEGYDIKLVTLYVRLLALMGIKKLILTNAAGGLGEGFAPGNLMLITDHISQFVPSPLIGENAEEFGTRFPDMSEVYSKRMRNIAKKEAEKLSFTPKEGVYLQFTGPAYETPAEIRMAKGFGASAVGMSTAAEAMVARHCGIEVLGISLITNLAAGLSETELSHEEVKENAAKSEQLFSEWMLNIIANI